MVSGLPHVLKHNIIICASYGVLQCGLLIVTHLYMVSLPDQFNGSNIPS